MAELTENLLRLKLASGIGPLLLWRLIRRFGNADRLFGASVGDIAGVGGMTVAKAENVLAAAGHDPRPEMEKALKLGVNIIPYDDPEYPKPLLHSFDPPLILYVMGKLAPEDQVAIGVVGTRHVSPYGREQALYLSGAFARAGYTVVSGLARGIDTFAHIGALSAHGRTVGVLGSGFEHLYPEENRDLAVEMAASGAVVSEFPLGMKPSRTSFPARNRIIAAMGIGLLVVEAPVRSGSLITARLANEIGRTVFAVPGRVGDAGSAGCNKLIADGAVMVMTVDDVLNELNPSAGIPALPEKRSRRSAAAKNGLFANAAPPEPATRSAAVPRDRGAAPPRPEPAQRKPAKPAPAAAPSPSRADAPPANLTSEQTAILSAVGGDWLTVDDITESSGLPASQVAAALTLLRLKRLIEQGPGQTYRLAGWRR